MTQEDLALNGGLSKIVSSSVSNVIRVKSKFIECSASSDSEHNYINTECVTDDIGSNILQIACSQSSLLRFLLWKNKLCFI